MNPFALMFLGNTLFDWAIVLTIASLLSALLVLARHAAVQRLRARFGRHGDGHFGWLPDMIEQTRYPFLVVVALLVAMQYLELPVRPARILDRATIVVFLLQGALWGNRAITLWSSLSLSQGKLADADGVMSMAIIGFIARTALWSILCLMILDNLGVNITALVASLGIGGIAVALALQNVLGDVFASLSIVLDKPFVIGDFIIVDNIMGTVEFVGLKTTRLRSLGGEQIVFSNTDLLGSRIRNYKRMFERRVVVGLGVTYDTPRSKLEQIPGAVRRIIESAGKTRFDRAHFRSYGDFALQFEIVYYVLDPDYNRYMDIQQYINLELYDWFSAAGIEFAFPTSTVHLRQTAASRQEAA